MLTYTSLRHPRTQAAIVETMLEAAVGVSEVTGKGTSYVPRADGSLFMRIDYRPVEGTDGGVFVAWGPESRPFIGRVARALGAQKFLYVNRLADALASPAIEKVW